MQSRAGGYWVEEEKRKCHAVLYLCSRGPGTLQWRIHLEETRQANMSKAVPDPPGCSQGALGEELPPGPKADPALQQVGLAEAEIEKDPRSQGTQTASCVLLGRMAKLPQCQVVERSSESLC